MVIYSYFYAPKTKTTKTAWTVIGPYIRYAALLGLLLQARSRERERERLTCFSTLNHSPKIYCKHPEGVSIIPFFDL